MTSGGTSSAYEARYGWDRRTSLFVVMAAVLSTFVAVADATPFLRWPGAVLFGGAGLLMAYGAMSRKVAFRVDGTGVLLGGYPARYSATTAHAPWQDITAVVLWQQHTAAGLRWVGVARRPDAARLPGPGQGDRAQAVMRAMAPEVPADVALASRAVTGWRLDHAALTAAVHRFAPDVPVVGG
ncbi:hypothetical protein ACIREK_17760 [Streptomyces sp. NPDC102415]|uniref:hypothetical protein n=1 Tax=Streptomyces sp. NPDC102415 TaxID=3366173 RepID=UPI00380A97FC